MNQNTMSVSQVLLLAQILDKCSQLIKIMPEYSHLPVRTRNLLSDAIQNLSKKIAKNPELYTTKNPIQLQHGIAFREAAEQFVRTDPEAAQIMKAVIPEKTDDITHSFVDYIHGTIEPYIFTNLTEKAFDRIIRERPEMGASR